MALNECIIAGVDPMLWQPVETEVQRVVGWIISEPDRADWPLKERLSRLRSSSIREGEAMDEAYTSLQTELDV